MHHHSITRRLNKTSLTVGRRLTRPHRGMTLIELTATVVIVGLLATLAGLSYRGQLHKAQSAEAVAQLSNMRTGIKAAGDRKHTSGDVVLIEGATYGSLKSFGSSKSKSKAKAKSKSKSKSKSIGKTGDGDGDGDGNGDGFGMDEPLRLCQSASPVPSSFVNVKGSVYQSAPDEWSGTSTSGWTCLKVQRSSVQRYQYGYDIGAPLTEGSRASFTAWARGDLDGDGRAGWFKLRGRQVGQEIYVAPALDIVDETE